MNSKGLVHEKKTMRTSKIEINRNQYFKLFKKLLTVYIVHKIFPKIRSPENLDTTFSLKAGQYAVIPPSNLFKPNVTLVFINHEYLPHHIIL